MVGGVDMSVVWMETRVSIKTNAKTFDEAYKELTEALRKASIDFVDTRDGTLYDEVTGKDID